MGAKGLVVDTSVFIEHLRARDKATTTLARFPEQTVLWVSTLTVYELFCGADTDAKKQDVNNLLTGCEELWLDRVVVIQAAELFIDLRKKNKLIGAADLLIAATALVHNLPVKTLNIKHFERIDGLILL